VVLRTYVLNTGRGWMAIPGGLVRVAEAEGSVVSMQRGGHSKDAWVLNAGQKQRIVAMVCGPPPEGRARWSVRLITEEAAKRNLGPPVSRETIRILLENHELKPWREKNVVYRGVKRGVHRAHGRRSGSL
jgi:hypothetical protein